MKKRLLLHAFFIVFSCTAYGQWSPKAAGVLPSKFSVADICIVNEQVIWAVAFDYSLVGGPIPASFASKLLKSTDGGENWTEVFHNSAGGVSIHFFNEQEGVCINYNGGKWIGRTTDGGATWALVPPANIPNLLPGEGTSFSSASNALGTFGDMVCFGTTKGRIIKTEDRGKNWTAHNTSLGANSALQSMGFMDEKNGLAVSWVQNLSNYDLVRTTDGGLTWSQTGIHDFYEVDAIPCSNTFMAVEYWTDQRTAISSDFGQTWAVVDSTIDAGAAVFHTPELGWMVEAAQAGVGTGPALYKWIGDPLYGRSYVNSKATGANNGKTWTTCPTSTSMGMPG